jgi:N6-adenosine-specific RNA methylase IME4
MQELIIDDEFKSYMRPLSDEEYKKLEESILAEGIREPLVIWNGILLDGHHRHKIAQEHGIEYKIVEVNLPDKEAAKEWIITNQLGRRNLTPQEASYYRGKLYESRKLKRGENRDPKGKFFTSGNVADDIGKQYGVTDRTIKNDAQFSAAVDKIAAEVGEEAKNAILTGKVNIPKKDVEKIIEIKYKAPELIKPIIDGEKTIVEVEKEIKINERNKELKEQEDRIKEIDYEPLNKKYDVIVVDPPWPYGTKYDPYGRRAANPYPEMSLDEIKAIKLPAADDCVLWLWTTHKFMRYAFDIVDTWGFRDVAILTWVKDRIGLGSWLRSQTEFCIMAIKGSPMINLSNQSTVIYGKLREHSRKPDEFYEMVNGLCIGRKLDYFSREQREGWEQYGNDTGRF